MTTGYDSILVEIAENQDPIQTVTPTWTDISATLQTMTTNRGRDNYWDTHSPGTATFTFNSDFYAIPVLPNTPIRVSANDSTTTRQYLFTGFLRPQQGLVFDFYNAVSSAQISAVDALGLIAERVFTTGTAGNAITGACIAEIASVYDPLFPLWQTAHYDDGQTIMQDSPAGGTCLDAIQNLTFSEGGAFYVLGDGTVNFDDRMAIVNTSRIANNQVTFDDTGAGDSSYATHFSWYYPPVYTTATVTRLDDESLTMPDGSQGPQPFTFSEAANINLYGTSSFPPVTNAMMSSNTEAAALAERIVRTSNANWPAPKTLRLYPRRDNDQLDASVQRELRDRATFKNAVTTPAGTDVWVERIQHTVDAASKEWTCDLSFTSRDQVLFNIDPGQWLVFNDATKGLLDGTRTFAW